jgi:hypothetical protein
MGNSPGSAVRLGKLRKGAVASLAVTDLGDHDARVLRAKQARRDFYGQLGIVDNDVLAPVIGPALLAATRWPSRPAWRTITRDGRTAIASDALSDPWADEYGIGFGLDFWIEADERMPVVIGSWLMAAIHDVCFTASGHAGVRKLVDELGPISIEIAGRPFPAEMRNEHGRVGVLLGVPSDLPQWMTLPEGRARLVPITVLTRAELDHVVKQKDAGRIEVARRLAASPSGMRSSLTRPSVV